MNVKNFSISHFSVSQQLICTVLRLGGIEEEPAIRYAGGDDLRSM